MSESGPQSVQGLHHVTAITGDASANVAFYTRTLGMRLVKKTVNQDDITSYHLFYGDETGGPGTDLTFFDWPGLPRRVPGVGTVRRTSLAVPAGALGWWKERFERLGVAHGAIRDLGGRQVLDFEDPEGQRLRLVEARPSERLAARPWDRSPVPAETAIRGFHGVTLSVADSGPTQAVLREWLGFRQVGATGEPDGTEVTLWACGPGGPGTEVRVEAPPHGGRGQAGTGGVHHVAFRVPDAASHRAFHQRLVELGARCTPIIERYYFQSIYFREPGGILFEIATDGPGFATDEPVEHLGERLSLPPFLEGRRAQIEAALRPI